MVCGNLGTSISFISLSILALIGCCAYCLDVRELKAMLSSCMGKVGNDCSGTAGSSSSNRPASGHRETLWTMPPGEEVCKNSLNWQPALPAPSSSLWQRGTRGSGKLSASRSYYKGNQLCSPVSGNCFEHCWCQPQRTVGFLFESGMQHRLWVLSALRKPVQEGDAPQPFFVAESCVSGSFSCGEQVTELVTTAATIGLLCAPERSKVWASPVHRSPVLWPCIWCCLLGLCVLDAEQWVETRWDLSLPFILALDFCAESGHAADAGYVQPALSSGTAVLEHWVLIMTMVQTGFSPLSSLFLLPCIWWKGRAINYPECVKEPYLMLERQAKVGNTEAFQLFLQ